MLVLALWIEQASSVYAQKSQVIAPELQKLKYNLATAKHDTSRMRAYLDISLYFQKVQIQDDSALVYALKAEHISGKYPNYFLTPKILNHLGNAYAVFYRKSLIGTLSRGYYFKKTEFYYTKSKYIAKKLGNDEILTKAWYNHVILYQNGTKKYDFFKKSFEFINYMQNKPQLTGLDSLTLKIIYNILCSSLNYEMDSKRFNSYLTDYKRFVSNNIDFYYDELCILIFQQHVVLWNKKEEKRILEEYQNFKKTINSTNCKDGLDLDLSEYYFNIQEYNKSFQIMNDFLPSKYGNIPNSQLWTNGYLGLKYMVMGKNAYMLRHNREAIRYLTKANDYINSVEHISNFDFKKYTIFVYLAKAYKKAGNYRQALSFTEKADILYQQIHDVGIQALMAENDVHLEEIKQEKKIQEARTQTLLKEQEVEIQKKQKNVFLAISILALLSAAWAVFSFIKTRKQNRIISQQAAALEESNHMKDKIFALLSHDLRSPINRLVISLNQSIESQRTSIQSELKGVQDILNNVLYWASMQLKKSSPVLVSVPLQPLAEELMEEYRYALDAKGITFLNNIENDVEIKTDESYLKIVLRNLISNAIKFTEVGGYIQITCRSMPGGLEILLKDTGVGIATDKLDSLFQLPVPSVGTNKEKGTGLGLSLSHDIVQKLGGSLNIQSKQGKGTQVVVALPV